MSFLLLEDSSFLLLEDGVSKLLLDEDTIVSVIDTPISIVAVNNPLISTQPIEVDSLHINVLTNPHDVIINSEFVAISNLLTLTPLEVNIVQSVGILDIIISILEPIVLINTTHIAVNNIVTILCNEPLNITGQPILDGGFPLIPIGLLEPLINGQQIPYEFEESLVLNVTTLEASASGNNDPNIVYSDILDIDIFVPLPNYAGDGGGEPIVEPQVYAQSDVEVLNLDVVVQDITLWDIALPSSPLLHVNITSSVAQPYKDKRVKSIGTVIFNRALYWSQNNIVTTYVSTDVKATDGTTIVSVLPLREFTKAHSITTSMDISVNETTINALILEINEDSYDIIFTDGSFLTVKNDLLNKPLKFEPIFDGSDEYYISMEVLV